MLYTGKGDNGTTKLFDCPQGVRISKSMPVFESLGMLDELNSSLGYVKALSQKSKLSVFLKKNRMSYEEILTTIQQHIFCIQAELGGSKIHITPEQVSFIEEVIQEIEIVLPPIKSFIIPGGGEIGAYLDIVRTVVRRTERQVITLRDKKERSVSDLSISYLNRLSSILYALARFANYQEGYSEKAPNYK